MSDHTVASAYDYNSISKKVQDYCVEKEVPVPRWRGAQEQERFAFRANVLRGVLSSPMEWLHNQPVGDIMARMIGDAQVFMVGFNEATTELLDTWLFSISLFVAMMVYDIRLAAHARWPCVRQAADSPRPCRNILQERVSSGSLAVRTKECGA